MFRKDGNGYDLRYKGKKYSPEAVQQDRDHSNFTTGIEKIEADFCNLGAIAIRLNNSLRQRTALLGAMCRSDYSSNPVETAGLGGNFDGIFALDPACSTTARDTKKLEEIAHYTAGRGKVLNELSQPVKAHNKIGLRGEQLMWDVVHTVLWNIGINLPFQLSQQGFTYIVPPENISHEEYLQISDELCSGKYEIKSVNSENECHVYTKSGYELATDKFECTRVEFDPEHEHTQQNNGLLIHSLTHNVTTPLGWVIYLGSDKRKSEVLNHEDVEDMIKVMHLARGGFHDLTEEKKRLVASGLLVDNGYTLFTQNRTFNAVYTITSCLEEKYGFDPSQLMKNSVACSYKRMHSIAESTDIVEEMLTGMILNEMVQPLKKSQPFSERPPLPLQFNDTLKCMTNITNAFAFAYDVKKKDGSPALRIFDEEKPYTEDADLFDVLINGELANPDLYSPKYAACILATALLVSEQIILEQYVRDAIIHGSSHPGASSLKEMIKDPAAYNQLIQLGMKFVTQANTNRKGPALGLQIPESDEIIECLRQALSHDALIELIRKLYCADNYESLGDLSAYEDALHELFIIGEIMQSVECSSVVDAQSRGINAGVVLVMQKIMPKLFQSLDDNGALNNMSSISRVYKPNTKSLPLTRQTQGMDNSRIINRCPFFTDQTAQIDTHNQELPAKASKPTCCFGLFSRSTRIFGTIANIINKTTRPGMSDSDII